MKVEEILNKLKTNCWLSENDINSCIKDIEWCVEKRTTPADINDIFNAFVNLTPKDVKVLIIGQDPYPDIKKAHGLAFSYKETEKAKDSLKNIFCKIKNSNPETTNLIPWREQGVLLLNTSLTYQKGNKDEHKKRWKKFVNCIIDNLISEKTKNSNEPLFIMLWGGDANKLTPLTNTKEKSWNYRNIKISRSSHPSNNHGASKKKLKSVNNAVAFLDEDYQPFQDCNKFLRENNTTEVDWNKKTK